MKKQYYVYSEGYANRNPLDYSTVYLGNLELRAVDVFYDEDVDMERWEYSEDYEDDMREFIIDKWGGEKIIDLPSDFDPEFVNGLINHGFFDTLKEAQTIFNSLITGEINYNKLEINY